jgi:RNA polymerase sigma factor (sigma-70 family)
MQPIEEFAVNPAAAPGVSFESIFHEHYPRVVGYLVRLTGDRAQAEEIAADVFCKLSRHQGISNDRNKWMPWMYRVATNAGLDSLRSNFRRRRSEEAAAGLTAGSQPNALDDLLCEARCWHVRAVLESLKPRDAQLLLLRTSGLAYRELAETLGIQASSVGTLLARAEAEFERRYRQRYGDDL